jgi:hypothetical protein
MEANMAVQAAVTQFKKEMILTYEQRKSLLSSATTKEFMSSGLTVTWVLGGAGAATAVTRGQNGDIPYGGPTNTQVSATLVEKHAPQSLTGFDVFASQGNQTMLMQENSYAIIRRDQDDTIITELANATQDYGTGPLTLDTVTMARAILGYGNVPLDQPSDLFALITPAAEAYLLQTTEFTNADYVDVKPLNGNPSGRYRQWMGFNWIVSDRLPGVQTSAEKLFFYHRTAIGYAVNMGEEKIFGGFNEEQQRSWSLCVIYHVAKLLQNTGVVVVSHDGSAPVPT